MIDNSKIVETATDGLTVYRDDVDSKVVYLIPSQPQFRRDESGRPVFSFVKYFNGDTVAGAYCVFDVELTATDEQRARVTKKLGDVRFAAPHYVDGSATLLISQDTTLVQLVVNASKPSLVGKNITSFNAKLTAEGAQVFEAAMSRKAGHIVQVKYDLTAPARFGGVTIEVSYDATKIATFLEQISSGGTADLAKRIDQGFQDKQIAQVTINNEDSKLTEAAKDANRAWAQNLLANQLSNALSVSADVSDDERKRFEELARTDAATHHVVYRGWFWYWYVEKGSSNAQLSKNVQSIRSFSAKFTENSAHDWVFSPQGALPAITALNDAAGAPLKWEDYRSEVRLGSDDFYRQVKPNIYVNADWDRLHIDSVIVNVWYPNKPARPNRQSHVFRAPTKDASANTFKCSFAYDRDDKTLDFGYQFEVHFVGYSEAYQERGAHRQWRHLDRRRRSGRARRGYPARRRSVADRSDQISDPGAPVRRHRAQRQDGRVSARHARPSGRVRRGEPASAAQLLPAVDERQPGSVSLERGISLERGRLVEVRSDARNRPHALRTLSVRRHPEGHVQHLGRQADRVGGTDADLSRRGQEILGPGHHQEIQAVRRYVGLAGRGDEPDRHARVRVGGALPRGFRQDPADRTSQVGRALEGWRIHHHPG